MMLRSSLRCLPALLFAVLSLVVPASQAHEPVQPERSAMVVSVVDVLRDANGTHDLATVSSPVMAAAFTPNPALAERMFGYTRDTLWLRFVVRNNSAETRETWLEVGVPRLEDVRLYDRSADGHWRERASGMRVPVDQRELHSRYPAFPLVLAPGEQRLVYARIASRNAIALPVRSWDPREFSERERRVDLVNGLQFGAIFLMAAYGFLLFFGTRDRTYFYFGLMLAAFGLYELSFYQYGYEYLWPSSPDWNLRTPGFFLALTVVGGSLLLARLLDARRQMFYGYTLLVGCASFAATMTIPLLFSSYDASVRIVNYLAFFHVALSLGVSLLAWQRRYRLAGLLFVAFLFLWLTSFVRIGQVLGFVSLNWLGDFSQSWSIMVSGMLMAAFLSRRIVVAQHERMQVQRDILCTQVQAREELETEVQSRTADLRDAKEKAEQAVAAKSRFLTQLSHELRTPLHSVIGNTGLLLEQKRDNDDQRRLTAIERSGRHLLSLIDDVLEFVRSDEGTLALRPEPTSLRALMQAVLDELQPLAGSYEVTLLLQMDARQVPDGVVLDAMRLRQVLLNLIGNGCRHSQGSVVCLQVTAQSLSADSARLCFSVHDDGQGVQSSDQNALFDPFWQAPSSGRGSGLGLGLPISRQWVARMGGELRYEDGPNGGSIFSFCLEVPLATAPPERAVAARGFPSSGTWRAIVPAAAAVTGTDGQRAQRPSEPAMARLRVAAGLGLITDIEDWIRVTSLSEPQAAQFIEQVRFALGRVDIREIRRLAAS